MAALQKLDHSQIFLAYIALQGDPRRVALACNVEEHDVIALAAQENWAGKLASMAALKESDPNVQVQINRALAYVQASQLSQLIDGVIKIFSAEGALEDLLTTTTQNGSSFSTKPLTDLVKAAEAVQMMRARALGDSGRVADEEKASGASIALNVSRALNAVQQNPGMDAVSIVQKGLANDSTGIRNLPPG